MRKLFFYNIKLLYFLFIVKLIIMDNSIDYLLLLNIRLKIITFINFSLKNYCESIIILKLQVFNYKQYPNFKIVIKICQFYF